MSGIDESDKRTLTVADVAGELLEDWRWLLGGLHARFETGDFATGLRLVAAIGSSAEDADHHPDIELRYGFVQVGLRSHDVGGVTQRDVRLAREISRHAQGVGAEARPDDVRLLELALDTHDHAEIAPFWAAVLGLPAPGEGEDEVRDPAALLPTVWFQQSEAPEQSGPEGAPRQRWHLDVTVAPEVAERRVQAAVDAGGTLVSDARKPAFWVLSDAQGNLACICTPLGRTEEVPAEDPVDPDPSRGSDSSDDSDD